MKMKLKAIVLLLLTGMAASAQTIVVNTTDPATGSRFINTDNKKGPELDIADSVVRVGLVFFSVGYQSLTADGKLVENYFIDLNIVHDDTRLGCLEQLDGRINLTLEDGTTMECFQISDTDCDKVTYQASFALMPKGGSPGVMHENFNKLMDTGITKIEVTTTEDLLEYKIKKASREYMKKHFALIDKTVKAAPQPTKVATAH